MDTSSTAKGGGGSFKNRKPIGEIGCCESGLAESFSLCFSLSLWLSTYLPTDLSVYLLFVCLSIYLPIYLFISLSI